MQDIHNYERKYDNLMREIKTLKPEKRNCLRNYANYCRAKNLSKARTLKLVRHIKITIERHKLTETKQINRAKIYKIINSIDDYKYNKQNTTRDYKTALKQYLKYLNVDKKDIDIIRPGAVGIREPQELVLDKNIAKNMSGEKERLFVELSQEIGTRPGEMFNLRYNDIKRTDWGALVTLNGKTGQREVPVIKCADRLPYKQSKDYVFTFQYPYIYNKVKKMLKKQGNEDTYLYIFRKTRATEVLAELPGQLANQYMGWTKDSKMPKTYSFIKLLPGKPLIEAVLKTNKAKDTPEETKQIKLSNWAV